MSTAPGKRYIFRENPDSLRNKAAVAVAAVVWRHEMTKNHTNFRTLQTAYPKVENVYEVQPNIAKLINRCIEPMKKPLRLWLERHNLRVFFPFRKKYDIFMQYFDFISWCSDCTIDEVQTAKNMMACPKLDLIFKYKLACLYCFEDDVRRLWSDVEIDPDLVEIAYKSNSFVRYWDSRLEDEMDSTHSVSDGSIEGEMIVKKEPDNRSSLMYCWSRLKPDDQIEKAVFIVENYGSVTVKCLLRSLTKSQFKKVVKRCFKSIILGLASSPKNVEFALQAWHYMKDSLSGDGFIKLIREILDSELDINHQHILSLLECVFQDIPNSDIYDEDAIVNVSISSLLYDIWQDAPDHLKNHVLNNNVVEVLMHKLCKKDTNLLTNLSRDVRLLTQLLSQRPIQQNNSFWRKRWTDLIQGVSAARLDELMKLCFRNEKEISNFKMNHMTVYSKIVDYCDSLISDGHFNELNEFLTFCSSDRSVRAGLKRQIIWNPMGAIRFCVRYIEDVDKMRAFDEFISDISPDAERRNNLKCQMITSIGNFRLLATLLNCGLIRPVKLLVCSFLTRQADLKVVKRNFKQHCQGILKRGDFRTFDVDDWNDFLMWCLDNDQQQLDQIKRSIPIDNVYNVLFDSSIEKIKNKLSKHSTDDEDEDDDDSSLEEDLDDDDDQWEDVSDSDSNSDQSARSIRDNSGSDVYDMENIVEDEEEEYDPLDEFVKLDKFLSWYFSDEEKVNEFKLAKINTKNVPSLGKILANENKRLAEIVLRWFFNRDGKKIDAFKASLNR